MIIYENEIVIGSIKVWYDSCGIENIFEFHFDENDKCEYKIFNNSFKNEREEKSFIMDLFKFYSEHYIKKLENNLVVADFDDNINEEITKSKE